VCARVCARTRVRAGLLSLWHILKVSKYY